MADRVPIGAIVAGVGAAIALLTILTLSFHIRYQKRVHDAAAQDRVDQFKLSSPVVPQQSHYYPLAPAPITTSLPHFTSAPSSADTKRGRFQHNLPMIWEMSGTPSLPITQGKRAMDALEQLAVPTSRGDEPPAYTAG